MSTENIFDLTLAQLSEHLSAHGQPAYRAKQVWLGLYGQLVGSFDELTTLPQALRQHLSAHFRFGGLTVARELASSDGQTTKVLFTLHDGRPIETVLMRYDKRNTLCISTQAGCALGCVFCATGQMGFLRHLSSGEIAEQVLWFARRLKAEDAKVTNVVYMGMGEPFHNYENTMASVAILTDAQGFGLGARRLTISTVGLVPQIERFTNERQQVNLAVSLHAADDDSRSALLPVNKRFPIEVLMKACRRYVQVTGRRISFEWALIAHRTDTPEQAHALAKRLKGLLCHVNVIPLNPTAGYSGQKSERDRVAAFVKILEDAGITCTVRVRRGIDIAAGCGQLAVNPSAAI